MLRTRSISLSFIVVLILGFVPVSTAQQASARGQSSTLLPDGRTLRLGGFNAQDVPLRDAFALTTPGTPPQKLGGMNFARSGHSATVLPDGTVFIFGGVGPDGHLVNTAELFDPATQQFSILPDVLAVPRAFHTATLLTDGTVLLAGGIMAGGQFPDDIQLWDYRSRKALSFHALLMTPRQGHTAALLPDGAVRTSRGTDRFGRPVSEDEIYDPISKRFRFAGTSETADNVQPLEIAVSIPLDGVDGVPLQDPIALRFAQLLNVTSVTDRSFVLTGPDESAVPAKATAAEGGRLVFVIPQAPLQPGTTYVLRAKNVTDTAGRALPETSLTFQTLGQPPDGAGADWLPNSTWTDNSGITKFQELRPLQAAPGGTALAGQVLKLNGWPLQHVTLEIDGKKTRTDSTGRFLLQGLTAGHHVLWIDGSTANHAGADYGVYEVGTTILPNKTNVLNYTIWMTRLDLTHAVTIPSPTNTETTVITNPLLPGLELRLPAGTVITDRSGKTVRRISITPVSLNKPPFPLPAGVQVPLYFTIQPGGAYISVRKPGAGPTGARLIYPNAGNLAPGAPFEFWDYDADAKGWYIYGLGKVSGDGLRVVPDPGVVIYEFTGAMVGSSTPAPGIGTPAGSSPNSTGGDPVQLSTGQFIYSKTDLALPDTAPISLSRTYIANDSRARAFGIGTTFQYDIFMVGSVNPYDYQELILPDGGRVRFDRISPGTGWPNALYVHASSGSPFYGALLSPNTDTSIPGFWKLVLKDGTIYSFPESSASTTHFCQAVIGIQDRYGNRVRIDRNGGTSCRATKINSPNGRYITLAYDSQGRVSQAADNAGRTVAYTYDTAGRLSTVTDPNGGITTYTYDDQNRMLTIKDARNIVYLTNEYDAAGRVKKQTQVDGGVYQFAWTAANGAQTHNFVTSGPTGVGGGSVLTRNGCWGSSGFNRYDSNCGEGYMPLVAQVDVTGPRGYVRRVVFGSAGYITSDTHALGQPEEQAITSEYYADNTLKSVTDPLGRKTTYDYDANGNLARVTRLDGTPDAVTTTFTYEPKFNHLANVTDPLNHTTSFSYDSLGNLTSVVDPLNHATTFTYNGAGLVNSVADALNNTVQFGYFAGDLASVIDPLGNVSTSFFDAAGRVISAVDAQGHVTRSQYNNLNLVTQVTDPQGNNTTFSYDPNGNLLSLTDALNHATSYTYDNMDRVVTRTDPLLRQVSYAYDVNGNLASSTDRKNQVTSLTYDPLDRLKLVGYNTVVNGGNTTYESTIGYTYDAGNRMTQAVDSPGGTIIEAYDNLDRLTSETTAQGQISYGYDLAGRRASMTVAGQPQVTYSYDNANRLTQIAQGASTVGFSYDNANRRSTLTLSNGVNMSYTYDNDSRVTGITYKFNTNTLGNLSYTYDSLGRRAQVGGSFAQTGLPGAVTAATYDAANELTNWNGVAISYDLNGNMLSDGINSFFWNARDQVATLNSVSLQYDAFGRRTRKTQSTSFLFDGANAVQELSGSTALANLLSGGIDEVFTRSDSGSTFTQLKDVLGSTIALVDSSGTVQTTYAYDPFGNTTTAGVANSNVLQYTGRENEGNSLYYYRARYYSPLLGRFINEDPLGFAGGDVNIYAYVGNDPIDFVDPFGLQAERKVVPRPGLKVLPGGKLAGQVAEGAADTLGADAGELILGGAGMAFFSLPGIERCKDEVGTEACPAPVRQPNQVPGASPMPNLNPFPLPGLAPLAGRKSLLNNDDEDDRCRKIRQDCQDKCWEKVQRMPVLPQDRPGLLRRCIRQCLADEGCHNF